MTQKKGGERDIELVTAEGIRFMQVRARPLLQANAESSGLVLVLSDITRMRELEGMRKTFVANVSHELRTPLTSIQGFAETLLNPAVQDPQEMKKYIAIIQKHATRLNQIIEDLLALSRLEKDIEDNQIELKMVSVGEVIQNALEVCQVSARAKQISLVSQVDRQLEAEMDRNLLEQAVVNLIDNAIRYSDPGKSVKIQAYAQGTNCRIQVTDEGIGIPEKHLGRIFERFYRVDKARGRDVGGTGLGLSIVKYIASAHRGQVEAQSQVGQGSTFSITIPLKNRES
ncbi:MAG: ATP-binding protein [Bdellovibrionota bacterium]